MDFQKIILKRQSCRSFDPSKKIPREILDKILEAGRLAPTAVNGQPFRLWLATGPKAKAVSEARTGETNPFIVDADCFIVMTEHPYNVKPDSVERVENFGLRGIDMGIVCAHIVCAATDLGVDSCILGLFDEAGINRIIGDDSKVRLVIALGYATEGYETREKRRLPRDELIREL